MTDAKPGARELLRRVGVVGVLTLRAHPAVAIGSVGNAVLSGGLPVVAAWLLKVLLDRLSHHGRAVVPVAVVMAVVGLCTVLSPYVSTYLAAQLRRRVQLVTQDRLFDAVNSWPGLARFEDPAFYDRLRLAQQAGEAAPTKLAAGGLVLAQNLITFCGFLVTLWTVSPAISAIVLVAALPAVRVQLVLSRNWADVQWWNSPGARRVQFYANLLSGVQAAKEIRLFGLAEHLHARMRADLTDVHRAERAVDLRGLRGNLALGVLGAFVAGGGIVWTAAGAASGRLTVGDVSVFVTALVGTQAAIGSIVQRYADIHQFLLGFGHFAAVLGAGPDLVPVPPADPVTPVAGIEFQDVWFRYRPDLPWVLRGVDLVIPPGRSMGLVGLNGAGKSTVVKLLCRFYDPDRGRIRWDGVDIRELDPAVLRDRIGAVFQDFMCYELTATDNIAFGDLPARADHDRLVAAAREAGVHDVLTELPAGYDTLLSRVYLTRRDGAETQQGTLLSGGQWQRLALARAALRADRDLLILDEPSSGLDPEAEHEIHERLRTRRTGRTSLLISHRLGALRDADHIVVLATGRIAEQGTHDQLLAANGEYARLFTLQASGYDSAPVP